MGSHHARDQQGNQPKIHAAHDPALLRGDFEITRFLAGFFAEQRKEAGQ